MPKSPGPGSVTMTVANAMSELEIRSGRRSFRNRRVVERFRSALAVIQLAASSWWSLLVESPYSVSDGEVGDR